MTPESFTALIDEMAACREQLTLLDRREDEHHTAITARLTELVGRIAHLTPAPAADTPAGYQPGPGPAWWKLTPDDRHEPLARLRAWVEQIYRPGYGHLAAGLGPCWASHDLCLYGLDILADLWSALYLQPSRTPAVLSAQAEYQIRVLPALADQLRAETNRCGHPRSPAPSPGHQPRSMP
jgi:hypothetical protein